LQSTLLLGRSKLAKNTKAKINNYGDKAVNKFPFSLHDTFTLSSADVVQRAAALRPFLAERAAATERDGRVLEETTDLIKKAGLHRLGQPTRFGGFGYPLSVHMQVGFELARACTSTSWCVLIANSTAWFASYWPLEVQEEIWGEDPDVMICLSGIPTGKCRVVEGGFEVWGSWPFASNSDNSDWAIVSAPLVETEGSPPETAWFLVKREELEIDHDSWNVVGMCGTGSKTLSRTEPLFVPRRRMLKLSQMLQGSNPGRAIPGNDLAAFNFGTFSGISLIGPMLGAAQGAVDWYVETMKSKVKTTIKAGTAAPASLTPALQMRVGDATSRIDAAMALLRSTLQELEPVVLSGESLPVGERVRLRRDIGFAARQASRAVSIIIEGAGASAMAAGTPIQRAWRDVTAGTRHVTLETDAIFTMYGQERFGLQPVGAF
jgi:alkylation response protein AidB-like acyl-CoA dehydrogenase